MAPLGLALSAVLVAGCSSELPVSAPRLDTAEARACSDLVDALPASVADQPRRDVDAGDGYAAAWGDPAIELRCGVARPRGLNRSSVCQVANGVGWYIPDDESTGASAFVTITTVNRAEYVSVRIPAAYAPASTSMVDLGPAVKRTIRQLRPCV